MKAVSYLVRYRDHQNAQTLNFGPFVSNVIADYFRATLPMPLKGGFCNTHPIQPFTAQDGHRASELIMRERELQNH